MKKKPIYVKFICSPNETITAKLINGSKSKKKLYELKPEFVAVSKSGKMKITYEGDGRESREIVYKNNLSTDN